ADRDAVRLVELRAQARGVHVSGPSRRSRQRRHDTPRSDLPDRVVGGVGDVDDASAGDRQADGLVELRGGAGPVHRAEGARRPARVVTTPEAVTIRIVSLALSAT